MKQQAGILIGCVTILIVISTVVLPEYIDPVTLDVIPGPEDALYNRAPDVLPWILPEMHDTAYWIERMKKSDEIILTMNQIKQMNKNYQQRINSQDPFKDIPEERIPKLIHWWPGFSMRLTDLHIIAPGAVADTVRTRIKAEIKYIRSQDYANPLAIPYNAKQIDDFVNEMALDKAKDRISVRDGITVRTTRLRNVPSLPEQPGKTQSGKMRWDLWNIGVVKIGKPVMILHLSKSGEYMFVLCEEGYGWLRSEDVAFDSQKEIDKFVNSIDFVVATADRVPFYTDESCTCASGWFGMGALLPLVSKSNPFEIKVPVRRMNGQFTSETAWLKKNNDVHVGFLPYTRRNIVETAFKLLDKPYDWSGAWFGRQHETTYRDIFACFGFNLPNHGSLFTFFNDNNTTVLHPKMGKEYYYKKILENEPFVTIQSCGGHCQLLLGEYHGEPIVFDQHGYGYRDKDGTWHEVRRCNIGDLRLPMYFLKRDVTFLELK
ncbi:SH3 domain-containing protein [Candidatus Latescibacterota bacterium]